MYKQSSRNNQNSEKIGTKSTDRKEITSLWWLYLLEKISPPTTKLITNERTYKKIGLINWCKLIKPFRKWKKRKHIWDSL